MNSIIKEHYALFEMYQALRNQLLESLTVEDLMYRLNQNTPSLGQLCVEIGEVEQAYIQSFQTFKMDFSYRNQTEGLIHDIEQLTTWLSELDHQLKTTIEALSEETIQTQKIDRGHDFIISPQFQLEVYKEALLIFYGKVSVYLKGLEKPTSEQWMHWIG
ncbi:DinB family protein [Anaerolineales bacterium HSG6]|nr:DinB family protein [Anaerolineales bacterium HSG6]